MLYHQISDALATYHSSIYLRWGHGEDIWLISFSFSQKWIPWMQSKQSRTLSRVAWSTGWLPWWEQPISGLAVLVSWQDCNKRQFCIMDRKYIWGFFLLSSAQGKNHGQFSFALNCFFGNKCCKLNFNTQNILSSLWHLIEGPSYPVHPVAWCPQTLQKSWDVSSSRLVPMPALVPLANWNLQKDLADHSASEYRNLPMLSSRQFFFQSSSSYFCQVKLI